MDYIEQIQLFNRLLPNSGLSSSGVCLWYGLMYIFSTNGWKREQHIPMSEIMAQTALSRFTIARARERLVQLGLIRFFHPDGSYHVCYEILPLSEELLAKIRETMVHDATSMVQKSTTSLHGDTSMLHDDTALLQKSTISENAYIVDNNKYISQVDIKRNKENSKRKKKEKGCAQKERKAPATFVRERWLSTLQEPWQGLMSQWLEYKAARKETYKTEVGARKCLTMLQNLSAHNAETAQRIIDQSIACNYAGLFPLKSQSASLTCTPQKGQHIGQIKQPESEEKRQRLLERFANSGNPSDNNK